jgi:hypothetical protein
MAGFAKAMMPDEYDSDVETNNLIDWGDDSDDEESSEDLGDDDSD